MVQLSTLTAVAVFIASAAAQSSAASSTHISVFEPGNIIPASGVAGSIVGVDAVATTIAVGCTDNSNCGLPSGVTLTQGASTFSGGGLVTQAVLAGNTVTVTLDMGCNIVSTTEVASCLITGTAAVVLAGQTIATTTSSSSVFPSNQISYDQLLITAGVDKLSSPQATQTPSSSSSSSSSAAAAPLPTGNVGLSVGGIMVAAAVAAAGML